MKKRWAETAGILIEPLLCLIVLEGMARGDLNAVFRWMTGEPLMAVLNYLFLLGLCLLISHFRSMRVRVCLWLGLNLLCAVLGMANYYKLIYRLEPILLTDVTQIHEALETMGGMDFHFDMARSVGVGHRHGGGYDGGSLPAEAKAGAAVVRSAAGGTDAGGGYALPVHLRTGRGWKPL